MSSLTTGPFQNLSATWAQLMQLTPQQMADASAPDYLKIAAMNAQDNIRQQGQPAAGPAAPPVAQQIVDKAVGAPPAGQAMPASQAPTQMAAQGGYIHDYGVASLPYEANYGHGGIVSFDGTKGSEVQAPPAAAETEISASEQSEIADAWSLLKPYQKDLVAGALATGASLIPYGKWIGALGKFAYRHGRKLLPLLAPGAGVVAGRVLDARSKSPPLDAAKKASETEMSSDPAATEEPPEKDPLAGLGGGVASLLQPVTLPAYAEQTAPEVKTREQIKQEREESDADYGVGKNFYEEEKAKNDAKLSALEAERKGVYSGQGLMDFGAALASGQSSNFLDNFAGAVPSYTGAVKSGNEYARNRQDLLDTHADLLRGQQRSEGRSDSTSALAEKAASVEANRLGRNVNIAGADARNLAQVNVNLEVDKGNAELKMKQAEINSRVAIAGLAAQLRAQAGRSGLGLTALQTDASFTKFRAEYAATIESLMEVKGLSSKEDPEEALQIAHDLWHQAQVLAGVATRGTGAKATGAFEDFGIEPE